MSSTPTIDTAICPWPLLEAPAHWHSVDLIADLHLQVSQPATVAAWQQYLNSSRAQALFILGDLFEVWVGDDAASPGSFEAQCQHILKSAAQRLDVFFMPGNRDFLLGPTFAKACHMRLLADPTVLAFGGQRWLLSHGDALCLADVDYQQFRATVRSPAWQADFLAKPLSLRQELARALRKQSQAHQASSQSYADIDSAAALQWLDSAQASTLIHGHTHRPAEHLLDASTTSAKRRLVLSDWDASANPARLEVLRLQPNQPPKRLRP